MTKLDCNVSNCMYNADKKCSKNDILIDGSEANMVCLTLLIVVKGAIRCLTPDIQ